jgi:hypothetical protein
VTCGGAGVETGSPAKETAVRERRINPDIIKELNIGIKKIAT